MKILQVYSFLLVLVGVGSAPPVLTGPGSAPPVLTGPGSARQGSKARFRCRAAAASPPVTYRLIKNRRMIAMVTHHQENLPAEFEITATAATAGSYHCMVTAGGNTTASNSISLVLMRTRLTSDPDPPVLYEGSRLVLSCEAPVEPGLSYTWFFDRSVVTPRTAPPLRPAGARLLVERVTALHAGRYSCMTTAGQTDNRSSSSRELTVIVKAFLSQPRISFSFSKEAGGYEGAVTCWTSTGGPPASFSLSLDGEEVASRNATASMTVTFPVAMVPAQDMGAARCRVKTDIQDLWSETQPLVVVPVGGHVEVEVEYLYGADSKMAAVLLHCRPSRGTFPSFSWLLNGSALPAEPPLLPPLQAAAPRCGLPDGGRSLVLTRGGGSYRCRVRDSFDDSAPWFESPAVMVRLTEGAMTTMEIISISFCSFLLLVLVAGCVFVMRRLGHRRRANVRRSSTTHSAPRLAAAFPPLTAQRTRAGVSYDAHRQILQLIPVQ